uniref:Uncharacterized protein n=1 Tax=Aquisalinus luteolus TaxID=1566827 RepID=A0A8J3A5T1_9PROT|nr:hypothetical protein GCM10011355_30180 [Aquisalinus luteolus]
MQKNIRQHGMCLWKTEGGIRTCGSFNGQDQGNDPAFGAYLSLQCAWWNPVFQDKKIKPPNDNQREE